MPRARVLLAAPVLLALASSAALGQDDSYLRGYITAVVEREYGVPTPMVEVNRGVVRLTGLQLSQADREKLVEQVRRMPGVVQVELATPPSTHPARGADLVTTAAKEAAAVAVAPVAAPVKMVSGDEGPQMGLLPRGHLFDPLIADPRWPDFSATYQYFGGNKDFSDMGATNFGGSLPIYRFGTPGGGASEIGLQAGVFGIFNLDAFSHDLVNADYFVGLTDSYRIGDFSLMARLWHQSSHLGDEFLLDHPGIHRVNLSWEQVDVLFSYDINRAFRVYAGPGWLFDQDPSNLGAWSVEYGVEWQSPWTFAGGHLRPVAAVDMQQHEREDWVLDLSVRGGVQIEGPEVHGNKLQLLLEYYTGRNPDGQFYTDSVNWYGLGLHWFF